MTRISSAVLVVLLGASLSHAQTAAQTPPSAATQKAVGHGAFPVRVTKTLDSSKLKDGDAVEVETSGSFKLPDGTLVPKGSKLMGHVTAAKARSKGDPESQLAVAFDKLNVADGKQLSVKGAVQAVFPPPDEVDPGVAMSSGHPGGPGVAPTAESRPTTGINTGVNAGSTAQVQPAADPKSVGVQGINGLELNDGVLTSKGKNVKLGDGVRMIVRVEILG